MSLKVLTDADVLVYWSAFAAQKYWYHLPAYGRTFEDHKSMKAWLLEEHDLKPTEVEVEKQLDVLPEEAFYKIANNNLQMIRDELMSNDLELFLTGAGNFREEVATLKVYKGNRVAEKPHYYDLSREYFLELGATLVEGQEADDAIGIRQFELNNQAVVATIDKDLMQIPGKHYNWNKDIKFVMTPEASELYFWRQMLMGDTSDNIPGIKGIGEKKAEKLLPKEIDLDAARAIVIDKFTEQYGQSADSAITEVGQLLYMRRKPGQMWTLDNHDEYFRSNV